MRYRLNGVDIPMGTTNKHRLHDEFRVDFIPSQTLVELVSLTRPSSISQVDCFARNKKFIEPVRLAMVLC